VKKTGAILAKAGSTHSRKPGRRKGSTGGKGKNTRRDTRSQPTITCFLIIRQRNQGHAQPPYRSDLNFSIAKFGRKGNLEIKSISVQRFGTKGSQREIKQSIRLLRNAGITKLGRVKTRIWFAGTTRPSTRGDTNAGTFVCWSGGEEKTRKKTLRDGRNEGE